MHIEGTILVEPAEKANTVLAHVHATVLIAIL